MTAGRPAVAILAGMPSGDPSDDARSWPVRRTTSAGGVVVRERSGGREVALIRTRSLKGDEVWGLPKGLVEPAETPREAAVREVREETGLEAEIADELTPLTYWFAWAPERVRYRKTVHLFLMHSTGGRIEDHDHEVEEVRFVPLEQAASLATHRSEKAALKEAAARLSAT